MLRRCRLWCGVVAAVLVGSLAVPAPALPPSAVRSSVLPARSPVDVLRATAYQLGLPRLADLISRAAASAADPADSFTFVTPVHDLDHDRRDDLVVVHYSTSVVSTAPVQLDAGYTLALRSGRTGRLLWRRRVRHTVAFPLPARVGPDGHPGVVEGDHDV